MSGVDLAGFLKVGVDVLTTTVDKTTGKILAQTGCVTDQTTDANNVEWWQHTCFASRPSKPDAKKKAAQCLTLSMGDRDVAIASQDVRCLDQYGNLDFGEFCVYAPGDDAKAQARIIGKKDGSVTLFTTNDNTKDGKSVYFRVATDGFLFVAPWGTIRFDSTGFHILHASGASLNLGGIAGLPSPLDVVASYIKFQAGSVSAASIASPVADATATIAALAALQAQITAIAAGFAKLALVAGPVQGTDAVAANALVVPAFVAGAAAVGVQSALLPKGSGLI